MASAAPTVRPTVAPHQSLPTQVLDLVQKVAQEIFDTLSFFAALPVRVFYKHSVAMQALSGGYSMAFKICCAVSLIFGSNALQKALQEAFLDDPGSPDYFKRIQFLIEEKKVSPNLPPTSKVERPHFPPIIIKNPAFAFLDSRSTNQEQKMALLEWLLDHGADPNFNSSSEPLTRAVITGNLAATERLLYRGNARTDLFIGDFLSCLSDHVDKYGYSLMGAAFANLDSTSSHASEYGTENLGERVMTIITLLVMGGADPNLRGGRVEKNPTFAFLGADQPLLRPDQKIGLLEWLLDYGADPNFNTASEYLFTKLIEQENTQALTLLIEHGARTDSLSVETKKFMQYKMPEIYELIWGEPETSYPLPRI